MLHVQQHHVLHAHSNGINIPNSPRVVITEMSSCSWCVCLRFQAKGFELSYLEKVPEVKDTVHKQSLLHHVCSIVVEKFPDSSDLYSEIGAITRSAKVSITSIPFTRLSPLILLQACTFLGMFFVFFCLAYNHYI